MIASSLLVVALVAFFLAWLIGADSVSPSFGPVACSSNIGILRAALLGGFFAFLGAILQGENVAETVGTELLSGTYISPEIGSIILIIAGLLISIGIIFHIPVPTVFATVGGILGAGIAMQVELQISKIGIMVAMWILAPFAAISIGLVISKLLRRFLGKSNSSVKTLNSLLLVMGAFAAYSAGSNQVGLAMGILSNSVSISLPILLFLGGIFIFFGALVGGPRIINAVSRGYSELGVIRAISSLVAAGIVIQIATFIGVPVSFNEAIIGGIVGSGLAAGREKINLHKIGKTWLAWILVLFSSIIISFLVVSVFLALF